MTITADQVKELRERTGAGMMECKKALVESNGNIDAAIEAMRKSGMAKAAKKADRTAAEGVIGLKLSDDHKTAFMVEVNCETDFVARDENLIAFADAVAAAGLAAKVTNLEALLALPYNKNKQDTIEHTRQELVAKLGENVRVRRCALINSSAFVGHYKHGNRIGVLLDLSISDAQLGKDVAMHIAASNPQALSPEDVAPELITKEREIFSAQALSSGKPAAIVEKMIDGRINKFLSEVSLLGQPFVKNPEQTVNELLKASNAKVSRFIRFEVGEGIEKVVTDFAEEVAQARKSA